jgi:hypothetical protein
MKLSRILLATAVAACSALITQKDSPSQRSPADNAPRKLELFVRAKQEGGKTEILPSMFGSGAGFGSEVNPFNAMGLSTGGQPQPNGRAPSSYGAEDCHPKCTWTCGNADCDEVCDPVCAPPQCETACAQINLASCRQRCDPPKCAVVCPSQHCAHGGCPSCKTVCAPPKCKTECSEQCESKCSTPQCTWKCNPGQCEKPRCSLTCGGARACGLEGDLNARPPPFQSGMTVLAKGLAAADPQALQKIVSAGNKTGGNSTGGGGGNSGGGNGGNGGQIR